MRIRTSRVLTLVIVFMIVFTIFQLYSALTPAKDPTDATILLHQVSLFQLELVHSFLSEASRAATASDLDALKQAVYSAQFSHERLMSAVDEQDMPAMQSISDLMQYILRLQIGGDRPLGSEESEVFAKVQEPFGKLYEEYKIMLSSKGEIIASQKTAIEKWDTEIQAIFKNSGFE